MGKKIIIAEKPSVGRTYASVLHVYGDNNTKGYIENGEWIVTWSVGHLVSLSYPEKYDEEYKKWNLADLPFIPERYLYEPLPDTIEQFNIVRSLYNRPDIDAIYYAGDSGREGLYIQMLIRMLTGRNPNAKEYVVWIDSQTSDEILRGIREAKPLSAYSNMSASGFIRAIEDYSVGINISRALTCKYSEKVTLGKPIATGRVMTCVQGMVVDREREIENFKVTNYSKVMSRIQLSNGEFLDAEWKMNPNKPHDNLYSDNGFLKKEDAQAFINSLPKTLTIESVENKRELKYAPLLFDLTSLQKECSKLFHIGPDDTLKIAQKLYEAKMTTYPRTDADVLSSAIAREISGNIEGLAEINGMEDIVEHILANNPENIENTKYTNDKKVVDHYAIIPTGQYIGNYNDLSDTEQDVYMLIVKRFLSIFMPPAEYQRLKIVEDAGGEKFYASGATLVNPGFLSFTGGSTASKGLPAAANQLAQGQQMPCLYGIFDGQTTPPSRYTSGNLVDAMKKVGNLVDDQTLKDTLKATEGIGTSATRAATITKLERIGYIEINKKTQVVKPTQRGIAVYEIIKNSIPELLNPKMTAQWEEELNSIVLGTMDPNEYQNKIHTYVRNKVSDIKNMTISPDFTAYIKKYGIEEGGKSGKSSKKVTAEAYLNVPFEDKDEVKALGAYFDPNNKMWYIPKGKDVTPFQKWITTEKTVKKIYLNVPFDDRDEAKAAGARWDNDKKLWYALNTMDKTKFKKWPVIKASDVKGGIKKIPLKVPFEDKDTVKALGARWSKEKKTWYILSTMDKTQFAKWL